MQHANTHLDRTISPQPDEGAITVGQGDALPPAPLYDALRVGQPWVEGASRFVVSPDLIEAFRDATGNTAPAPVPSMLASIYVLEHMRKRKTPPGGVHAKQRFTFLRPVRVGETLITTSLITEKFIKKGRRYLVTESETRDEENAVVTTGMMTAIWGRE